MDRRKFLTAGYGTSYALCTDTVSAQIAHDGALQPNLSGVTAERATVDVTCIDPTLDFRSISPENPTGERGAGGRAGGGRKGRPCCTVKPKENITIADISGPGTIRHIWMTLDFSRPEIMRAMRLEVYYDGLSEPSISVPLLDFFGLPHGRRVQYYSALTSVNEGLGLNSYIPIPFGRSLRIEFTNHSQTDATLFYQVDYTLEPQRRRTASFLHASFRRENPTVPGRDFVIAEGLKGPGRFLGCCVGIRVLDTKRWYGEGEVKIYRDGDRDFPTYCGTGLEDYVGSAWNLSAHHGYYSGAPLNVPNDANSHHEKEQRMPVFTSFYRWHILDPIMFSSELRMTIQQIGGAWFTKGQEQELSKYKSRHRAAAGGWMTGSVGGVDYIGMALIERSDDFCATAYLYCDKPQAVPRFKNADAVRDVELQPGEHEFDKTMADS